MVTKYPPVHPGKILLEEFILCFRLTEAQLARSLGIPRRRINEIVLKRRGISADTAVRLALYFGNSAEFWMELQMRYELEKAKRKLRGHL
ncbi:MAG: HigA family addiction module antitoxin [Patescibacteria group bacterium]